MMDVDREVKKALAPMTPLVSTRQYRHLIALQILLEANVRDLVKRALEEGRGK